MSSNLPPGVTNSMIEAHFADGLCEVCFKDPTDCICPECVECGSCGDPTCYSEHGMKLTKEQLISRYEATIWMLKQSLAQHEQQLKFLQYETDPFRESSDGGDPPFSNELESTPNPNQVPMIF